MTNISKKDIEAFARIIKELGRVAEADPDALLALLERTSQRKVASSKPAAPTSYSPKVKETDLYAYAKQHSEEELTEYLRSFSVNELKEFVNKYNLGYTKLKAVDSISQYIAQQLKKRTVDVFMRHEK